MSTDSLDDPELKAYAEQAKADAEHVWSRTGLVDKAKAFQG